MGLSKIIFSLMFLIGLVLSLPAYSSDLDDECKNFCTNNGFDDGHYLPPEPGAKCKDGYEQSEESQICCCKPKAEEK